MFVADSLGLDFLNSIATPVDMPLGVLLGKPPRTTRKASHRTVSAPPFATGNVELTEAIHRVLRLPTVADKTFLITIGDRTVGGLTARDQMVGRWQVPVADAAVTATSFDVTTGEAMAMGERAPVALLDGVSLTAVPEPGAWGLMLLGVGGLGAMMRRRRQPALG